MILWDLHLYCYSRFTCVNIYIYIYSMSVHPYVFMYSYMCLWLQIIKCIHSYTIKFNIHTQKEKERRWKIIFFLFLILYFPLFHPPFLIFLKKLLSHLLFTSVHVYNSHAYVHMSVYVCLFVSPTHKQSPVSVILSFHILRLPKVVMVHSDVMMLHFVVQKNHSLSSNEKR